LGGLIYGVQGKGKTEIRLADICAGVFSFCPHLYCCRLLFYIFYEGNAISLFITILGLSGAGLCILAYALLSMERIDPKGMWYFILNGVGGLFLLISISYDYDSGDTGGLAVETCWVIISLGGIAKVLLSKKDA
jgi:hypothetical protein